MSRRAQENIVVLAIIAFFAAVVITSMGYGPRARFVPIPIASLGIILALAQLIWQNLQSADELHIDLLEFLTKKHAVPAAVSNVDEEKSADTSANEQKNDKDRIVRAFGMVAVFVGMILLTGIMPAIFIFTTVYFVLSKHYSWAKSLFVGLLFGVGVYLLFVVGLELQIYHGILQPVVDWYYETF